MNFSLSLESEAGSRTKLNNKKYCENIVALIKDNLIKFFRQESRNNS